MTQSASAGSVPVQDPRLLYAPRYRITRRDRSLLPTTPSERYFAEEETWLRTLQSHRFYQRCPLGVPQELDRDDLLVLLLDAEDFPVSWLVEQILQRGLPSDDPLSSIVLKERTRLNSRVIQWVVEQDNLDVEAWVDDAWQAASWWRIFAQESAPSANTSPSSLEREAARMNTLRRTAPLMQRATGEAVAHAVDDVPEITGGNTADAHELVELAGYGNVSNWTQLLKDGRRRIKPGQTCRFCHASPSPP